MTAFRLTRNSFGQLEFHSGEGEVYKGVIPVRSFPIANPDRGIAIVNADGRELAWIESLSDLHGEVRRLLEEELASREFLPRIRRILDVSSFATPSTWQVETDRGDTSLLLKGEENIRRLSPSSLLIADGHGIQFLISDVNMLDKDSRKLLDRFL